jgi:malonate transporter
MIDGPTSLSAVFHALEGLFGRLLGQPLAGVAAAVGSGAASQGVAAQSAAPDSWMAWAGTLYLIVVALSPVFVVLALGYFAGRRKLIDNANVSSLNVLLMQFALPITLFVSIAKTPKAVIVERGALALVLALSLLVVYLAALWIYRRVCRLSLGEAAVAALTTAFPNFASIGLPLLVPIFGADAGLPVAVAIAVGSVTISPLTLALLELHKAHETDSANRPRAGRAFLLALRRSVSKPIFIGPMAGLAVALSGLQLPNLVAVALGPLIGATAGIGLFLTGLMVSAQGIRLERRVALGAATKNILQPVLTYALVRLFGMSDVIGTQAVLLSAISCGFFGVVFGASAGVRSSLAGSTLVVSTVASIATLSIAIVLIAHP